MRRLEMQRSNLFLAALVLTLSACATTQEPTVRVVTQEVKVPIEVACKQPVPVEPLWCFDGMKESADIHEKVKCLLSDRQLSKGYSTEAVSNLKACK